MLHGHYISSYTSDILNHTSHRNPLPLLLAMFVYIFQLSMCFLNIFFAISEQLVCTLWLLFVHFMWLSYVCCLYFLSNENVYKNELQTLGTKSFIILVWEITMVVFVNLKLNLSLIKTCSILPNRIQYSWSIFNSVVIDHWKIWHSCDTLKLQTWCILYCCTNNFVKSNGGRGINTTPKVSGSLAFALKQWQVTSLSFLKLNFFI